MFSDMSQITVHLKKRQLKRIVLAVNASYLLAGAETECITKYLSDSDIERYQEVQSEIAYSWLKRAGFETPMSAEEIMAKVIEEG